MPKICLLLTGGTIGMIPNPKTGALEPPRNGSKKFLKQIPHLNDIADIDILSIMNVDSSNIATSEWTKIASTIYKNYKKYDGFVVAHGTDTMSYTASAVSFALQNLGKPVVFTGSLLPTFQVGTDAINNLTYACQVATMNIAEVCIVFSDKILRGNRSKKINSTFLEGFDSPSFSPLGTLNQPITLNDKHITRSKLRKPKYFPDFNSQVGLVKIYPGFNPSLFDYYLQNNYKAVVIESFGAGNVPCLNENSILSAIEKLTAAGVVVVIGTQMIQGETDLSTYEAGLNALNAGAIGNKDMTIEATITKLMHLCARYKSASQINKHFQKNLAGEMTE